MSNKQNLLFSVFLFAIFAISLFFSLYFFGEKGKFTPETETARVSQSVTKIAKREGNTVSLTLTGDVMLGRNVMNESATRDDFTYPFINVSDYLKTSDVVFINLENPIVTGCPKIDSGFTFCSIPESVDGLLFAGIDVVSLANNHTQNFGQDGFSETLKLLNEKGILTTGNSDLTVKQFNGLKFGFLGFDFTVHEPVSKDYQLIKNSDPKVDVLVVGVHWGVEYEDTPRDFQREWARLMVVNGADVVAGNHPHWVQGAECFWDGVSLGYTDAGDLELFSCLADGKAVYYALGNFVFDQMWSEETKKGVVVKLVVENGKLVNQEVRRTYIRSNGQPQWVN